MADCVAHAGVGSERVSRGKVHGLVGRRDSCTMPEIPGGLRFRALFQTLRLPHGDFSFLSTLLRTLFFRARFFSRLFPRRISRCSTRETVYITWRWCVHAADELRAPLRSSIVVDDGTIPNERVKVTGEIRPEQLRSRIGPRDQFVNLSSTSFDSDSSCFFYLIFFYSSYFLPLHERLEYPTQPSRPCRFYTRQNICCCLYWERYEYLCRSLLSTPGLVSGAGVLGFFQPTRRTA